MIIVSNLPRRGYTIIDEKKILDLHKNSSFYEKIIVHFSVIIYTTIILDSIIKVSVFVSPSQIKLRFAQQAEPEKDRYKAEPRNEL